MIFRRNPNKNHTIQRMWRRYGHYRFGSECGIGKMLTGPSDGYLCFESSGGRAESMCAGWGGQRSSLLVG